MAIQFIVPIADQDYHANHRHLRLAQERRLSPAAAGTHAALPPRVEPIWRPGWRCTMTARAPPEPVLSLWTVDQTPAAEVVALHCRD